MTMERRSFLGRLGGAFAAVLVAGRIEPKPSKWAMGDYEPDGVIPPPPEGIISNNDGVGFVKGARIERDGQIIGEVEYVNADGSGVVKLYNALVDIGIMR